MLAEGAVNADCRAAEERAAFRPCECRLTICPAVRPLVPDGNREETFEKRSIWIYLLPRRKSVVHSRRNRLVRRVFELSRPALHTWLASLCSGQRFHALLRNLLPSWTVQV